MKKDISSEIVPFSNTGIEKLCRSSVELVQYARNMAFTFEKEFPNRCFRNLRLKNPNRRFGF